MTRRTLFSLPLAHYAAAAVDPTVKRLPVGINTYCLRALRWNDLQLLDYAASLKLDAVFLQDSIDPQAMDPGHWKVVRDKAVELGLRLETGGGSILPKSPADTASVVETMRKHIERAKALGSPVVRFNGVGSRAAMPPGPVEKHMETMISVLRQVRTQTLDAGLKLALEPHKDFQSWEYKEIIEGAGRDFAGILLDTGNPLYVMENPMTAVETLSPYAVTFHLRDHVVYQHPRGAAIQCVPLGEGTVDFRAITDRVRKLCPNVFAYIKPITGRPPEIIPFLEELHWKAYPQARAVEFAQFVKLANSGQPYDRNMVVEDLAGRPTPPHFLSAIQYQQKEHMERSLAYGRKNLGLGIKQASA